MVSAGQDINFIYTCLTTLYAGKSTETRFLKLNIDGEIEDSIVSIQDSTILILHGNWVEVNGTFMIFGTLVNPYGVDDQCGVLVSASFKNHEFTIIKLCSGLKPNALRDFVITKDSTFLAVGYASTENRNGVILMKLDMSGKILWWKIHGQIGFRDASSIALSEDENSIFIFGISRMAKINLTLYKFDKNGNLIWEKVFSSPVDEGERPAITRLQDGNLLLTSSRNLDQTLHFDSYAAKVNPNNGNIIWERYYPSSWNNAFFSNAIQLTNSNILVAGYRGVLPSSGSRIIRHATLYLLDNDGNIVWERIHYFEPENENYIWKIQHLNNAIWTFGSTWDGFNAGWLMKLDSLGCSYPNCAGMVSTDPAIEYEVPSLSVSPNPASNQILIRYHGMHSINSGNLHIDIYNIQGRLIHSIPILPTLQGGEVMMDVSSWTPGLYITHLRNDNRLLDSFKFIKQ